MAYEEKVLKNQLEFKLSSSETHEVSNKNAIFLIFHREGCKTALKTIDLVSFALFHIDPRAQPNQRIEIPLILAYPLNKNSFATLPTSIAIL